MWTHCPVTCPIMSNVWWNSVKFIWELKKNPSTKPAVSGEKKNKNLMFLDTHFGKISTLRSKYLCTLSISESIYGMQFPIRKEIQLMLSLLNSHITCWFYTTVLCCLF